MAKVEIRDLRGDNGGARGGVGETRKPRFRIAETAGTDGTETAGEPGVESNSTGGTAERATATVTVSDPQSVRQTKPVKEPPNQTAPKQMPKAVTQPPSKIAKQAAEESAKYLLTCVEVGGSFVAGDAAAMSPFERGLMTPALARILERTPAAAIEKFSPLMDGAVLALGTTMYLTRVMKGAKLPSNRATVPDQSIQRDMAAPAPARVEQIVPRTKAGDVDGIAVPVPSVLTEHMNGTI